MRNKLFHIVLFFIFLTVSAHAQDNHYWSKQYGARSTAMSGAVIGGVRDNSSVYYNPGAMGFCDENTVSADATAYAIGSLRIKNAMGTGNDISSNQFMIYPQSILGILHLKKFPKIKIGYGMITRQKSTMTINERIESNGDILTNIIGNERYIGAFEYNSKLDEYWGGWGIAYKINDKFSFGLSNFAAIRIQSTRNHLYIRAFPTADSVLTKQGDTVPFFISSTSHYEDIRLTNINQIIKLGFAYNGDFLKIGLAGTFPGIRFNMVDLGEVQREVSMNNVGGEIDGEYIPFQDYIAIDRQKELPVYYKSPWSVALGIEFNYKKNVLAIAAEYFSSIKPYTMIQAEKRDDYGMPPGMVAPGMQENEGDFLSVAGSAASVINLAIGYERKFNDILSFQCGFRTDLNHQREATFGDHAYQLKLAGHSYDLYHANLGFTAKKSKHYLTIALGCAFIREKGIWQYINMTDPYEYNPETGDILRGPLENNTDLAYTSVSFIFGYTRIIGKEKKEKDKE